LTGTNAPACLIEYGFHTNQGDVSKLKDPAYRDKLAIATVKGICDYLDVPYKDVAQPGGNNTGVALWASEAWGKAKQKGILDGTRPTDQMTRQEFAVALDKLNLI
jgi:hypothetical protein